MKKMILGLALLAAGAAVGAKTIDQQNAPAALGLFSGIGFDFWQAQTFTAGASGVLDSVSLIMIQSGGAGPITVTLTGLVDNTPDTTVIATSSLAGSAISSSPQWVDIPFHAGNLVAGQRYAIVVASSQLENSGAVAVLGASGPGGGGYLGGRLLSATSATRASHFTGISYGWHYSNGWYNPMDPFDDAESGDWAFKTYLVSSVPEPETYALLLSGIGLLGAVARRRKAR